MYKTWLFCDSASQVSKTSKLQEERHPGLYLLVRKAHCCVKQGSILLIAQSASSVAVISIFTVKEQVVDNTMRSTYSVAQVLLCQQALTFDEPQLLLFWPGL